MTGSVVGIDVRVGEDLLAGQPIPFPKFPIHGVGHRPAVDHHAVVIDRGIIAADVGRVVDQHGFVAIRFVDPLAQGHRGFRSDETHPARVVQRGGSSAEYSCNIIGPLATVPCSFLRGRPLSALANGRAGQRSFAESPIHFAVRALAWFDHESTKATDGRASAHRQELCPKLVGCRKYWYQSTNVARFNAWRT